MVTASGLGCSLE